MILEFHLMFLLKERKKSKQALTFCEGTERTGWLVDTVGRFWSLTMIKDREKVFLSSTTSAQAEADYSQGCSGWASLWGQRLDELTTKVNNQT